MFNYRCYAIHDYRSRCAGNENRSSNDTWHFSFRFYLFDCRFGGNLVINETFKVSFFCLQQRRLFTELLSYLRTGERSRVLLFRSSNKFHELKKIRSFRLQLEINIKKFSLGNKIFCALFILRRNF